MFDPHNSMLDSFFEDPHVLVSLLVSGNEASGFVLAPRIWSSTNWDDFGDIKLSMQKTFLLEMLFVRSSEYPKKLFKKNVKLWHKDRRTGGFQVCSPEIGLGSVVYIDSPHVYIYISLWTYIYIYLFPPAWSRSPGPLPQTADIQLKLKHLQELWQKGRTVIAMLPLWMMLMWLGSSREGGPWGPRTEAIPSPMSRDSTDLFFHLPGQGLPGLCHKQLIFSWNSNTCKSSGKKDELL